MIERIITANVDDDVGCRMHQVGQSEIESAVEAHQQWLKSETTGRRANFAGHHLSRVTIHKRDLTGAIFSGAKLEECELEDCCLAYADFASSIFDKTRLTFCDISASNFSRSKWSDGAISTTQALSEGSYLVSASTLANFTGASFDGVSLDGEFCQAQFENADLKNVTAEGAYISECQFGHARIQGGHFENSTFAGCWFGSCSISSCDLTSASVRECNFDQGVLTKLAFIDADLSDNNLRNAQLADLSLGGGQFINLNNQALLNELDAADDGDERYAGACFYFTGGPLPKRAEIEWSDELEQNLWIVRC